MSVASVELPDFERRPAIASSAPRAVIPPALARILTSCPGITRVASIAIVGARAAACQLALARQGFACVTAASVGGGSLLRERYDCVCAMDRPSSRQLDAEGIAALRRRLLPGGSLVLDVSSDPGCAGLTERLRAADFRMLQYRVVGVRQPDGTRRRAVFLVARLPHAQRPAAIGVGAEIAAVAAPARRAA